MRSILGEGNMQDKLAQMRGKMSTRTSGIKAKFPQLNSVLGQGMLKQGGLLKGASVGNGQLLNRIKSGKMAQGGILSQIRGQGKLGILKQDSAWRGFSGADIPTPGTKPGQSQETNNYRSFAV